MFLYFIRITSVYDNVKSGKHCSVNGLISNRTVSLLITVMTYDDSDPRCRSNGRTRHRLITTILSDAMPKS